MNEDAIGLSFVLGVCLLFVGVVILAVAGVVSLFIVIPDRKMGMVWLGLILSLVGGSLTILALVLAWIDYGNRYDLSFEPTRGSRIERQREQHIRDLGLEPKEWFWVEKKREGEAST